MELLLFLIAPPVLTFAALAFLPASRPAAIGCAIFAVILGIFAFMIYPLRPPVGPDDWYHGIEQIPFWASVFIWFCLCIAQTWRFYRLKNSKPAFYPVVLFVILIAPVVAYMSVG